MTVPNKKGLSKEIFAALLFGTVVFLLTLLFRSEPKIEKQTLKGQPVPNITFELDSGETVSLEKKQGRAILINFWALWCEPCMQEMPSLKMIESRYKNDGLLFLAFNVEGGKSNVRAKLSGLEMPEGLVFNFDKAQLKPFNIQSLPLSVLIDRFGVIRQVYRGARNWLHPGIRKEIESVLR